MAYRISPADRAQMEWAFAARDRCLDASRSCGNEKEDRYNAARAAQMAADEWDLVMAKLRPLWDAAPGDFFDKLDEVFGAIHDNVSHDLADAIRDVFEIEMHAAGRVSA